MTSLPTDAESLRELSKMAMQDGDEGRGYQLYWAAEAVSSNSPYAPVLLELIGELDRLRTEVAVTAEQQAASDMPCPFCGGIVDPVGWLGHGVAGPECNDCGATTPDIEAWNRRTLPLPAARPDPRDEVLSLANHCRAFFASVIKSGEAWSDECERANAEALAAIDALKGEG